MSEYTFLDWCKETGFVTYKNRCMCGGYRTDLNGRNPAQPHMHWCDQLAEHKEVYAKYLQAKKIKEAK